jgi:hypothetical protein
MALHIALRRDGKMNPSGLMPCRRAETRVIFKVHRFLTRKGNKLINDLKESTQDLCQTAAEIPF